MSAGEIWDFIGAIVFFYGMRLSIDDARKRLEHKLDILIDELAYQNREARRREREMSGY